MLLEIHRGDVDDFFKLWPEDKTYFFSKDNKSFVAYAISNKVAVCLGDPVGPTNSIKNLLDEFKVFCHNKNLGIAFIQTSSKYKDQYKAASLKPVLIGADAIIDLDEFTTQTVHNKYFRNIVNRFSKQDFSVKRYTPPHNKALLKDLRQISDSWLKLPRRKEWKFLTGRFSHEYLQQLTIHVLYDSSGHAKAFASELPSYEPGVATIDLMRHRVDAPPNSIDYLFIKLLEDLCQSGYLSFSLGLSPLDGRPAKTNLPSRFAIKLFRAGNHYMGFKGLHQFKSKFKPSWQQRFVWYEGSPLRLVRIGIAVTHLLK